MVKTEKEGRSRQWGAKSGNLREILPRCRGIEAGSACHSTNPSGLSSFFMILFFIFQEEHREAIQTLVDKFKKDLKK